MSRSPTDARALAAILLSAHRVRRREDWIDCGPSVAPQHLRAAARALQHRTGVGVRLHAGGLQCDAGAGAAVEAYMRRARAAVRIWPPRNSRWRRATVRALVDASPAAAWVVHEPIYISLEDFFSV